MTWIFAAAVFFLAIHLLVSGTPVRDVLVRRLGDGPYLGLFSLASVAGLVWLAMAFASGRAEVVQAPLWDLGAGARHLHLPLQLLAVLLVVIGLTTPNPASVGQAGVMDRAEGVRGILRVTRHPFLCRAIAYGRAWRGGRRCPIRRA